MAVVANRVDPDALDEVRALLVADGGLGVGAIPELPTLIAPSVAQLIAACDGRVLRGDSPSGWTGSRWGSWSRRCRCPNVLIRLHDNYTVIAPGDRYDLLPGLVLAHYAGTFPPVASIVLTGGYLPPEPVQRLIDGLVGDLPIIVTELGTYETATVLSQAQGKLRAGSTVKVDTALRVFAESVDVDALIESIQISHSEATTPLMFQFRLIDRAREDRRHIVLPEGDDDRILLATDSLLRLGVADITILGDENAVRTRASTLGLTLGAARGAVAAGPGAGRAVRRGVLPAASAQGDDAGAGPRGRHRRVVLRHDDGAPRPRRRDGLRGGAHHRAHHQAVVRDRQDGARARRSSPASS